MYDYNDRSAAIKGIQHYLYVISQRDESIPHVTVDGYFTEELKLAVLEFQKLYGLEQTGAVDRLTFDLMYEIYLQRSLEAELADKSFEKNAFPLKIGDSGSDVGTLNSVLWELGAYYKELNAPKGDFFSASTEQSVREMQNHLLEDATGIVDLVFFDRLKKELNIRQNINTL